MPPTPQPWLKSDHYDAAIEEALKGTVNLDLVAKFTIHPNPLRSHRGVVYLTFAICQFCLTLITKVAPHYKRRCLDAIVFNATVESLETKLKVCLQCMLTSRKIQHYAQPLKRWLNSTKKTAGAPSACALV